MLEMSAVLYTDNLGKNGEKKINKTMPTNSRSLLAVAFPFSSFQIDIGFNLITQTS